MKKQDVWALTLSGLMGVAAVSNVSAQQQAPQPFYGPGTGGGSGMMQGQRMNPGMGGGPGMMQGPGMRGDGPGMMQGPGMQGGGPGMMPGGPGMMHGGPGMMHGGPGMGPGAMAGPGMMGPGMMGGRGMQGIWSLDLNEKQRQQIGEIMAEQQKQQWERRARMQEAMAQLTRLYAEETPDPQKVGEAYEKMSQAKREMAEGHVRAHNSMWELLTEQQRQQLRGYGWRGQP